MGHTWLGFLLACVAAASEMQKSATVTSRLLNKPCLTISMGVGAAMTTRERPSVVRGTRESFILFSSSSVGDHNWIELWKLDPRDKKELRGKTSGLEAWVLSIKI